MQVARDNVSWCEISSVEGPTVLLLFDLAQLILKKIQKKMLKFLWCGGAVSRAN